MRYALLLLLLPLHVFAQAEGRSSASPLNVTIHKKGVSGEIFVSAIDEGSSKLPLRLTVRAKCGPNGKWKTLDAKHESIPGSVCYVNADGEWNEGLQTLTIRYFLRSEKAGLPKTIEDGEYGPCDDKFKSVIDLRSVCAE